MLEERSLSVGSQLIYHVIYSQAGSLGKALLEYVMNSIDAAATKVDINLSLEGFKVVDDGSGFGRIEDIEAFFEVFGFDHGEDDHRAYGKFGMGRAQGWSFASTIWRTGPHEMDVDIKNRGLTYYLKKGLKNAAGCTITGTLYEPLLPSQKEAVVRELTELAAYAQIPITVNGSVVNRVPSECKWDTVTDDAYIKLRDTGELAVYNLGVLVRKYPSWQFGTGGVVVSRTPLQVNMARNDILLSQCEVWRRVEKHVKQTTTERTRTKRTRLTDTERGYLASQVCDGDISYDDARSLKLITDITGRHWPLSKLEGAPRFTVPPQDGDLRGERLQQQGLLFVLSPQTLERFHVETADALASLLRRFSAIHDRYSRISATPVPFSEAAESISLDSELLNDKELTPKELAALRALRKTNQLFCWLFRYATGSPITSRSLRAGISQVADAWTDGRSYIGIERGRLKLANDALPGFTALAHLLAHEYCHDSADLETHQHGQEFYEAFHEVCQNADPRFSIGAIASSTLDAYISEIQKLNGRLNKRHLAHADRQQVTLREGGRIPVFEPEEPPAAAEPVRGASAQAHDPGASRRSRTRGSAPRGTVTPADQADFGF